MPEKETDIPAAMPTASATTGGITSPQPEKSTPSGKPKFFHFKSSLNGKFDVFKLIKFIYPLTILVIVLVLFGVMSFLYNNVYLTMAQAEIVTGLKSKVIEESIDFTRFNSIIQKIANKAELSNWPHAASLPSPFSYGSRPPYPDSPATITETASSTPVSASTTAASTAASE